MGGTRILAIEFAKQYCIIGVLVLPLLSTNNFLLHSVTIEARNKGLRILIAGDFNELIDST